MNPVQWTRAQYWRAREVWPEISRELLPGNLLLRARAHLPKRASDYFELDGIRLPLGPNISPRVTYEILTARYEIAERRILAACLEPSDRVLEIGAGIGLLSTFCAQRIGSDRVIAFEANPALIAVIRRTYALNGLNPDLRNAILGAGGGTTAFYVNRDFWSSSTVRRSASDKLVEVPNADFAETVRSFRPTFLVVDIEGGEFDLLMDASLDGIQKIAIELHERVIGPEKTETVRQRIRGAGFRVDEGLSSGQEQLLYRRVTH